MYTDTATTAQVYESIKIALEKRFGRAPDTLINEMGDEFLAMCLGNSNGDTAGGIFIGARETLSTDSPMDETRQILKVTFFFYTENGTELNLSEVPRHTLHAQIRALQDNVLEWCILSTQETDEAIFVRLERTMDAKTVLGTEDFDQGFDQRLSDMLDEWKRLYPIFYGLADGQLQSADGDLQSLAASYRYCLH